MDYIPDYDDTFFAYINNGSINSAEVVVPIVKELFSIDSVLDVGCGVGAWLTIWDQYIKDYTGIDGKYINQEKLLINPQYFISHDLNNSFHLSKKFELVQCLEVAEHLPEECAKQLVENLCLHSDIVMFSAAPPGQGGDNHINEKNYAYWQDQFLTCGYLMLDIIRPSISCNKKVKVWYKYNIFIYMNKKLFESKYKELEHFLVIGTPKDISSFRYKIRKTLLKLLPIRIKTILAKIKEKSVEYLNFYGNS